MHADHAKTSLGRGRRHRRRVGTRCGQRRYVLLAVSLLHAGEHVRARAGDQGGGPAVQAQRRGPPEQGPAPLPPRGSHAPHFDRRRDERNDHGRNGRVPPGNLYRADSPRVRRRGRGRRSQGQLSRGADPGLQVQHQAQKQTGGSGQYAHMSAASSRCRKTLSETFVFEDEVTGGRIPKNFIPAIEKGFRQMVHKGPIAGYPVVGLKVVVEDGSYRDVDSSDMAFQTCARTCMRENFSATRPVLLEPVMRIEIECPTDFQGSVVGNLTSAAGWLWPPRSAARAPDRRRSSPLGDLRLLDRSPQHDPGQRHLYYGICQVSPHAGGDRARGHRRGRSRRLWQKSKGGRAYSWRSAATIPGRNSRLSRKMRWKRS